MAHGEALDVGGLFPIPIQVHRELSGQLWMDGNNMESTPVQVTVEGTYYLYMLRIFTSDEFSGDIHYSDTTLSTDHRAPLALFYQGPRSMGFLNVFDPSGNLDPVYDSSLMQEGFFSTFVLLQSPYDGKTSSLLVSAPASSRKEAVDLANRLFRNHVGFD